MDINEKLTEFSLLLAAANADVTAHPMYHSPHIEDSAESPIRQDGLNIPNDHPVTNDPAPTDDPTLIDDPNHGNLLRSDILAGHVEAADVAAVRDPSGWLTDTCIREMVSRYRSPVPSRVNFVDPTWLSDWESYGCPQFTVWPDIFQPKPGAPALQGLAMPYNMGNSHWVVVYVNLQGRGAVLFDSVRGSDIAALKLLMGRFFDEFRWYFDGAGYSEGKGGNVNADMVFKVDSEYVQQLDGSSCGIYAIRTCLDLLEHRRPGAWRLSSSQIHSARFNGARVLEEIMGVRSVGGKKDSEKEEGKASSKKVSWGQNSTFTVP